MSWVPVEKKRTVFIKKLLHFFAWKDSESYLGRSFLTLSWTLTGFPGGSVGKESACNAGDPGLFPESGRSPGEENGNPLQYSCLENPMGRGAWWATVHGVARVRQDWASKSSPPPLCDVLENWRVLLRVLRKFNWKLININIKGKEGYFLWEKKSCVLI